MAASARPRDVMAESDDVLVPLIDREWYRTVYPDIAASGADPVDHYVISGWREGRWPNSAFDPGWYAGQAHGLFGAIEGDPLRHYLEHGAAADLNPIAWFDAAWYRETYRLPLGETCLAHYLGCRSDGTVSPNPGFSPDFYLRVYPDIATAGLDPFGHYLSAGRAEGRLPNEETEIIRASGLFDENEYLISSDDVLQAGVDPVAHYCASGWRERRRPNLYFDPVWYVASYAPPTHVTPLTHYILYGEAEGRRPSPYFDPVWYRAAYRITAPQSPLAHYLRHRRSQRYSPLAGFDVAFYVQTYRHLLRPDSDPFAHYLVIGTARDLDPAPWFNAAAYRRRHMDAADAASNNPLLHFWAASLVGRY